MFQILQLTGMQSPFISNHTHVTKGLGQEDGIYQHASTGKGGAGDWARRPVPETPFSLKGVHFVCPCLSPVTCFPLALIPPTAFTSPHSFRCICVYAPAVAKVFLLTPGSSLVIMEISVHTGRYCLTTPIVKNTRP